MYKQFALALTFVALATVASAQSGGPADEQAIRKLADEFAAAWNKGDAKAASAPYATDADLVEADGRKAHGRAEIEKLYGGDLAGPDKGTTIKVPVSSVRFLKPDIALVHGTSEISGLKGPDGKPLPPVKGLYTVVTVKHDGKWLVASTTAMVPLSPPAPAK